MTVQRACGEQIVWRRLDTLSDLARLRNALCGLLFDVPPDLVVSVLLFLDELCVEALDDDRGPVTVCLVRATDPHYLRIDARAGKLVPPSRPGFMDAGGNGSAGWGVDFENDGMGVWAYLTLPVPEPGRSAPPWSRLAFCLPRNPTLN
ncbi:hypothetical protein FPZ12_043705 [Amycolatopsis acidicola]|uniref:ATP-binding protein n=1 Tax=Amycolatopsis acidicola TaxID=2596893 RepID=A0A5N0UJA8_9PSEU|nr:hypothetical protein [Amycolatopsis acidicola]KAA9149220.1 hypothetical protein FPZ12_043705 [Amycolatopsis acidicola]